MSFGCKAAAVLIALGAGAGLGVAAPIALPAPHLTGPLRAQWFPLEDGGPHAAVLALHGCGGLYRADGRTLDARYPDYVALLHQIGAHVLLIDSWGSRGIGPQCSVRYRERTTGVGDRRDDVGVALAWLRQQPSVDASRLVVLGWSNGATTGLAVIDPARKPALGPLAGVALYYPGCVRATHQAPPAVPVLMQLGGDDDWTPPAPCEQLAQRWTQAGADVQALTHPGAVHGFDSDRPVRWRQDVPNGVNSQGVHQGGQAAANAASRQALRQFLDRVLVVPKAVESR